MAIAQRFNANPQTVQGATSGTNLSLNDVLPFQPITKGTSAKDEKLTLNQIQAEPYGEASRSGSNYIVTLINYPTDYTPTIGSKILVKFNDSYSVDSALYLTINGNTVPMLARGSAMGQGSITAGQIIEFSFIGTISDGVQTLTGANYSAIDDKQLGNSINGALTDFVEKKSTTHAVISSSGVNSVSIPFPKSNLTSGKSYHYKIIMLGNGNRINAIEGWLSLFSNTVLFQIDVKGGYVTTATYNQTNESIDIEISSSEKVYDYTYAYMEANSWIVCP